MLPWRWVWACWIATCPASASPNTYTEAASALPNTYTEGEDPLAGESVIGRGPIRSTAVAQTAVMKKRMHSTQGSCKHALPIITDSASYP
jgi:hypothetical protein